MKVTSTKHNPSQTATSAHTAAIDTPIAVSLTPATRQQYQQQTDAALSEVASIPSDDHGPVFREPWEADVFAITLSLHEQGVFTWPEWAAQLSTAIADAAATGDPDCGDTYYLHWLKALETVVINKSVGSSERLQLLKAAWDTAARSTPHGQPIVLDPAYSAR